jgi:hypothetical protein
MLSAKVDVCKPLDGGNNFVGQLDVDQLGAGLRRDMTTVVTGDLMPAPPAAGDTPTLLTPGRAVQVDSMKPILKAPGTKRLNLRHDNCFEFCLNFSFNFNLRRYTLAAPLPSAPARPRPGTP